MLGLPRGEVFIVPWSDKWESEFEREREQIHRVLGSRVKVHHIGSTSVRNLKAKPIIDIALEIEDFNTGEKFALPLEGLGYSYRGTNILPDRHYFNKGEPRTHQIHMYQRGSQYLIQQLKFRDHLRNNEQDRKNYEELKLQLTQQNKRDKHQYADDKTEFVSEVLRKIL
ncbi:GrpB family protein [Rossellomorea vietnamensis]|uniref:GrpB family protein n=1 Tax=Rossellomorea vietnamensis TaxID=218284 RepID=A0A5D4KJG7_9BACI|nr:GrpB family protein [Rossellomorea vietnamensis]TYR77421.1 GrpB family protein [Rossellomorea vietnamensis]